MPKMPVVVTAGLALMISMSAAAQAPTVVPLPPPAALPNPPAAAPPIAVEAPPVPPVVITPPQPPTPSLVSPQTPAAQAPGPATGAPVARVTEVPPVGPPIVIRQSQGTLVQLPTAANTVYVSDSRIADVTMKTPGVIYIAARQPGETALYALDYKDHVLLNTLVQVEASPEVFVFVCHGIACTQSGTVLPAWMAGSVLARGRL